jgi:hypothetical protein
VKRLLRLLPLIAILFFASTPAKADFSISYPDGSLGLVWAVGSAGHAMIFADFAVSGDDDIFTAHTNHSSTPLSANLGVGGSTYIGYWLDYLYSDASGDFIYDVYATQGGAFFFVGTYVL